MDINLDQRVNWETLKELAQNHVAIGKEYNDGISFYWLQENTLVVNEEWMNADSFATAIDALDIDAELAKADLKDVQLNRANAYPSIGDQLDMIYHAIDAGTLDKTSDFYTTIRAVKDAHPKPTFNSET